MWMCDFSNVILVAGKTQIHTVVGSICRPHSTGRTTFVMFWATARSKDTCMGYLQYGPYQLFISKIPIFVQNSQNTPLVWCFSNRSWSFVAFLARVWVPKLHFCCHFATEVHPLGGCGGCPPKGTNSCTILPIWPFLFITSKHITFVCNALAWEVIVASVARVGLFSSVNPVKN